MTLATIYEISDLTGSKLRTLQRFFSRYRIKPECLEQHTNRALYDAEEYNKSVNINKQMKTVFPVDLSTVQVHVRQEKQVGNCTTSEKIYRLRARRLPAMVIATRLGLDLVFVNEFLARKESQ